MSNNIDFDVIARDKASRTFDKVGSSAHGTEKAIKGLSSGLKTLGALALGGGIVSFFKDANDEARESQKVGAQTVAVIKSTSGAARLNAQDFGNLATVISRKTGIDDEQIQAGENMLATFTNIHDGLGKNNKIFTQATKLSTDLAVATKTGPVAANVLLGKALNDPAKGLGRLTKIGVTFTDQQKAQVAQMMKVGNTAGAQRVILAELAKEFGGSAEAQATAGDKLEVAYKNLEEQIGTALLPTIDKYESKVANELIPTISEFITGMQNGTGEGGAFAATLRDDLLPVAKNLGSEAVTLYNGLHPILDLFMSLPAPVKTMGLSVGVLSTQFAKFGPQLPATASGLERVGAGVRNLAGAGGMLALADASNQSNQAVGGLEGALGGAATGFAATGTPIGALIGGVGGGLLGIFSSGHKAAEGLSAADLAAQGYRSTLDDTTGAVTALTRAHAEEAVTSKKLDGVLGDYGFQHRQIVDAIVKGGPLRQRMVASLQAEYKATSDAAQAIIDKHGAGSEEYEDYVKANKARQDAVRSALDELGAVTKATKQKYASIAANREFTKSIKELPKNVQVQLNAVGLQPTRRAVVDLVRQFPKLSERDIKILIRENGGKGTAEQVASIRDAAKALGRLTPTLNTKPAQQSIDALLASVIKKAAGAKPTIVPKTDPKPAAATMSKVLAALQGQADAHPIRITTKQVSDYLFGPGATPSPSGKPSKPATHHNPPGPSTRTAAPRLIAANTRATTQNTVANEANARSLDKVASSSDKATKKHKKLTVAMIESQPQVKAALAGLDKQVEQSGKWVDRYKDKVSKLADQLNDLKDVKAGFTSTFSSDSIFGADMDTAGKSVESLLTFSKSQATNANQLLSDVQAVLGKGLSKSLALQLQGEGSSGAQQLHLLASASNAQIQQFNANDAQTSTSLRSAGLLLGNDIRGGSIDSDIAGKTAHVRAAQDQLAAQQETNQELRDFKKEVLKALKEASKDAGAEFASILGISVKNANSKGGTHR